MKKLYLIIILMSMQSQAVHLSSNDLGQVLIFPYYTVNGGYDTLINLVNTTDQPKALRVRFREAANGREVYTFNLYLGAKDAWAGLLVKGNEEQDFLTRIISNDASCTIPAVSVNDQFFNKDHYTGELADIYGDDSNRMYEGFIEVIEMGALTGDSAEATRIDLEAGSANCQILSDAWNPESDNNYWLTDTNTDLMPPTGGLLGNLVLIDVANGISISEPVTALADFSDNILHFNVDNNSPSLADGKVTSSIESNGVINNLEWGTGFEAVSSVLMKSRIKNEYVLDTEINAQTDWIATMPTKNFHTDPIFLSDDSPIPPFVRGLTDSKYCEEFNYIIYDREKTTPTAGSIPPIGPGPQPIEPIIPMFCFATNDITFFQTEDTNPSERPEGIFSSEFHWSMLFSNGDVPANFPIPAPYEDGWFNIFFQQTQTTLDLNYTLQGLPVIGFAVQSYVNANAIPGVLANYAGSFIHKSESNMTINSSNPDLGQASFGMSISNNKTGQVLLYPYYTVKNGINTLISLVNTTDLVKAVKVNFYEGKNGRDVLSFNVYLSPFDVWTAALVETESSTEPYIGEPSVKLITNDTSCTVPEINGQEFLPFAFIGDFDDGQGTNIDRVLEGSIEIIEMGNVIGDDAIAATHVDGVPSNCSALVENWLPVSGKWTQDPSDNLSAPDGSGGLYGSISLVDVEAGVDMSYDATAIIAFNSEIIHTSPGALVPDLSSGSNNQTLIETDNGFQQTTWISPLNAVTALFMQSSVQNDFSIETSINAETEWVNYYPTKRYYVDPLFSGSKMALQPFGVAISDEMGACEGHQFHAYNRDQKNNRRTVIPPTLPPPFERITPVDCWSVNVTAVGQNYEQNTTIFDSSLFQPMILSDVVYLPIQAMPFTSGWMQQDFVNEIAGLGTLEGLGPNGELHTLMGKPVIGFVAQKYRNTTLGDPVGNSILANYAMINKNKNKRKIEIQLNNKSLD